MTGHLRESILLTVSSQSGLYDISNTGEFFPVATIVNCFSKKGFKELIRDQLFSILNQCNNQIRKCDENLFQMISRTIHADG